MNKRRLLALIMAATMTVTSVSQGMITAYADAAGNAAAADLTEEEVSSEYASDQESLLAADEEELLMDPAQETETDPEEQETEDPGISLIVDPEGTGAEEAPGIPDYAQPFSAEDEEYLDGILVLPDEEEEEDISIVEDTPQTDAGEAGRAEEIFYAQAEAEEGTSQPAGLADKVRGSEDTILSAADLDTAVPLMLDQPESVEIKTASVPHYVLFRFTAPKADTYRFYSTGDYSDPYGELYLYDSDSSGYRYQSESDDEDGRNFSFTTDLQEGENCYIRAFGFNFQDASYYMNAVSYTQELAALQELVGSAQPAAEGDQKVTISEAGASVCLSYTAQEELEGGVMSVRSDSAVKVQVLDTDGGQLNRFTSEGEDYSGTSLNLAAGEKRYFVLEYSDPTVTGTADIYIGASQKVSVINSVDGLPEVLPKGLPDSLPEMTLSYTYKDGSTDSIQCFSNDKYLNWFTYSRGSGEGDTTGGSADQMTYTFYALSNDDEYRSEVLPLQIDLVAPSVYLRSFYPSNTLTISQPVSRDGSERFSYYLFEAQQAGTYAFRLTGDTQDYLYMYLYDGESGERLSQLYLGEAQTGCIAQTMQASESVVLYVRAEHPFTLSAEEGTTPVSFELILPDQVPSDFVYKDIQARLTYSKGTGTETLTVRFDRSDSTRDPYGNLVRLEIDGYNDDEDEGPVSGPGDYSITGFCGGISDTGILHIASRLDYYGAGLDPVTFPQEIRIGEEETVKCLLFKVEKSDTYYFSGTSQGYYSIYLYNAADECLIRIGADDEIESEGVALQADTAYLLQISNWDEYEGTIALELVRTEEVTGISVGGEAPHPFRYWSEIDELYPAAVTLESGATIDSIGWLRGGDVKGHTISCSVTSTPDGGAYASYEEMRAAYDDDMDQAPYGEYEFLLTCGEVTCPVRVQYVSNYQYRVETAAPVGMGETDITYDEAEWTYYAFTAPEDGLYRFSYEGDYGIFLEQEETGSGFGLTQYRHMKQGDKALLQVSSGSASDAATLLIEREGTFRIPEGENSVTIQEPASTLYFYADSDECGYRFSCEGGGSVQGIESGSSFSSCGMPASVQLETGLVYQIELYQESGANASLTVTRVPLPSIQSLSMDQEAYVQMTGHVGSSNVRVSYDMEQEDGTTASYSYPEDSDDMPYPVSFGRVKVQIGEDGETWWDSDDSLLQTGEHICVVYIGGKPYEIPFTVAPLEEELPPLALGQKVTVPANSTAVYEIDLSEGRYSACGTDADIILSRKEDPETTYSHYIDPPIQIEHAGTYIVSMRNSTAEEITAAVYPVEELQTGTNVIETPADNGRVWTYTAPQADETSEFLFAFDHSVYYMHLYDENGNTQYPDTDASGYRYTLEPGMEYTVYVDRYGSSQEEDPEQISLTITDTSQLPKAQGLTIGETHDTYVQVLDIGDFLDNLSVTIDWDRPVDEAGTTQTTVTDIRNSSAQDASIGWGWERFDDGAVIGQTEYLGTYGFYRLTVFCGGVSDTITVCYANYEDELTSDMRASAEALSPDTQVTIRPGVRKVYSFEPYDTDVYSFLTKVSSYGEVSMKLYTEDGFCFCYGAQAGHRDTLLESMLLEGRRVFLELAPGNSYDSTGTLIAQKQSARISGMLEEMNQAAVLQAGQVQQVSDTTGAAEAWYMFSADESGTWLMDLKGLGGNVYASVYREDTEYLMTLSGTDMRTLVLTGGENIYIKIVGSAAALMRSSICCRKQPAVEPGSFTAQLSKNRFQELETTLHDIREYMTISYRDESGDTHALVPDMMDENGYQATVNCYDRENEGWYDVTSGLGEGEYYYHIYFQGEEADVELPFTVVQTQYLEITGSETFEDLGNLGEQDHSLRITAPEAGEFILTFSEEISYLIPDGGSGSGQTLAFAMEEGDVRDIFLPDPCEGVALTVEYVQEDAGTHPVSMTVSAPSRNPVDDCLRGLQVTLQYEECEEETLTFQEEDGEYTARDSYGNELLLSGDTWILSDPYEYRIGPHDFMVSCSWLDTYGETVYGPYKEFTVEIVSRAEFLTDPEKIDLRDGTQVDVTLQPGEVKYLLLDCRIGGSYAAQAVSSGEQEDQGTPSTEEETVVQASSTEEPVPAMASAAALAQLFDADTETELDPQYFMAVRGHQYLLVLTNNDESQEEHYAVQFENLYPAELAVTLSQNYGTWTGEACDPGVTVYDEFGNELSSDLYTLTYEGDFTEVGSHAVEAYGAGDLAGMRGEARFNVNPVVLGEDDSVSFSWALDSLVYNGQAQAPSFSASYLGMDLVEGEDYALSVRENGSYYWSDARDAGSYEITAEGRGAHYIGEVSYQFTIEPAPLSSAAADPVPAQIRDQNGVYRPAPVLRWNSTILREGTDYIISGYTGDDTPGDASVTLEGKGNFEGTLLIPYTVLDERITADEMEALAPEQITQNTVFAQLEGSPEQWVVIDAYEGRRILLTFEDSLLEEIGFYRLNEEETQWIPCEPSALTSTSRKHVYRLEGDGSKIAVRIPPETGLMAEVSVHVQTDQAFTVQNDGTAYTTPQLYDLDVEEDWQYEISSQEELICSEYAFSGSTLQDQNGKTVRTDLQAGKHYLAIRPAQTDASAEVTIARSQAPEQLTLSAAAGIRKISLAWSRGKRLDTTYRIYRRAGDEAFSLYKSIKDHDTTSFTDNDVEPGVTYTYYMTGMYGAYAEGPSSEEVQAEPFEDGELPVVRTITPANDTRIHADAQISAAATDNYGVKSVAIYVRAGESEDAQWILQDEQTGDTCTVQLDTTQYPDGSIQVKAVATDLAGNVSEDLVTQFIVDNSGPSAVTGITEKHTNVTVTLSWEDVLEDDRARFIVEELQADASWKQIFVVNTLGANHTGLTPGSVHTYRVISVDDLGNRGGISETVTVTTDPDTTAPVVSALYPQGGSFRKDFAFSATAEDEYAVAKIELQYSTDYKTTGSVEAASWISLGSEEYTDPDRARTLSRTVSIADIQDDGVLTLRAIAWDYEGNESNTGEDMPLTQVMIDRQAPEAPSGLEAALSGYNVKLSWDAGEKDISYYRVFRALSEQEEPQLLMGSVSALNCTDRNVDYDTTYWYCISAVDAAGNEGERCNLVSIYVPQDEEAPVVRSISPADGSVLGGSSSIRVLVSDNNQLKHFFYRYSTDGGENWTQAVEKEIGSVSAGSDSETAALDIVPGELGSDTLQIEVWCEDILGNESTHEQAQYTIDSDPPAVEDLQYTLQEGIVTLTWTSQQETDLYGFEIFRGRSGTDSFSCLDRFTDDGIYSFTDDTASEGNTWEYYVCAVDEHGNTSQSNHVTVEIPEGSRPDKTNPRAYVSCRTVAEAGAEYVYSASGSYDDRGIISWEWEFGDGTQASGEEVIHTFEEAGSYEVTLTVRDDAGNTGTASVTVTVRETASIGTVKVTVVNEKGVPVNDAGVYFNLGQSDMTIIQTDGNGRAVLTAGPGVYPIGAYKDGYLPAKTSVTVLGNGTEEVRLIIEEKSIVVGDLKVHRMTLDEILEAEIDVADPANQHIFKFTIELTYCNQDISMEAFCDDEGNVTGGEKEYDWNGRKIKIKILNIWGGGSGGGGGGTGGGGGGGGWPTMEEPPQPVVAVVDIPGQATWLKDFFDAELTIVNQADPEFYLDNCEAVIHAVETSTQSEFGMTLMDSKYTTSSPSVNMGTIRGGETKTARWILRGDEPGSYQISADFSAVLRDFGAQISTRFEASDTVEVRGGDQLWLDIVTESRILKYTDGAIKVGFRNESDYPVYYPNIALEYVTPVRSYKMKGMKKIDTSRDILETGEELWFEYIIPREKWAALIENEKDDMYLINQILTQMSGIQMQYQFDIVQPMSICADKIEVYEYDFTTGKTGDKVDLLSLKKNMISARIPDLKIKTYKLNEDGELEPAPMTVRVFDGYQTLLAKNDYYDWLKEEEKDKGYYFDIDDYEPFREPWTVIETDESGIGYFRGYEMWDFSSQNYEEGEDKIQEHLDALWGNVKTQAELDKEEYEQENTNAKSNFRAFDLMFTASRAQTTIPVVVRGATAQEGTVAVTVSRRKEDGSYAALKGATVQIGDKQAPATDKSGQAVLTVPAGKQKLTVKKSGYLTVKKIINVTERTEIPVYLIPVGDQKHSYISNVSSLFNTPSVILPADTLTGKLTIDIEAETIPGEKVERYDYKIVDKDGTVKETEENIPVRIYLDITKLEEGDRLYFGVKPVSEKDPEEDIPVQWTDAQFTIVPKPAFLGDMKVNVSKMKDDGTFTLTKNAYLNFGLGADMFTLGLQKNKYDEDSLVGMLEDEFKSWKIKTSPVKLPTEIKLNPMGRIVLAVDAFESNSRVEEVIGWFNESLADLYGALESIKLDVNLDYDLTKTRWMMSVFGTAKIAAGKTKLADAEFYHLAYADASLNYSGKLQLGSRKVDYEEGEMLQPIVPSGSGTATGLEATGDIYLVGGSLEAALKLAAGVEVLSKWLLSKGAFLKLGFELGVTNVDLLGFGGRYINAIIKAGTQDTTLGQEKEHVKINEKYALLKPTSDYVNRNMLGAASEEELLAAASEEPDYSRLEEFVDSLTLSAASEDGAYSPVKAADNHSWSGGGQDPEVLEDGAYFEADPQIVSLGDGSIMMVYTDYQEPYDANNPLAVFYTICKNGVWSEPVPVRADGTMSVYPSLEETENGAHLTWLNVSEKVTGMEADNTLEEITEKLYQKLTVCEAWYDVQSGQWTMEEPVGNGCYIESAVSAANGGKIMTVWIENTANSTQGTEETPDSVCYRLKENGVLTDSGRINQQDYDVTGLTLAPSADGFSLSIETTDNGWTDHLYLTKYDGEWGTPAEADVSGDTVTAAAYAEDALFYLSNNAIYYKEETKTRQAVASELLNGVKEFSAAPYGENGAALAWSVDADPSAVYVVISDDGVHYSEPIAVALGDGTFGKPEIAEQSGSLQVVYKVLTEITTGEGENTDTTDNYTLRTATLENGINIAVTGVETDGWLSPGYEANTTVYLKDCGTRAAENVTVKIASDPEGEEVLAEQAVGDAQTAVLTWYVPLDYDGEEFYVIASEASGTEIQLRDNVMPVGSAERNPGILNAYYVGEEEGKTQISLLMENAGSVQTGPLTVAVTDITTTGSPVELVRESFESVSGGDSRDITLSIERPEECTKLYLEVISELGDISTQNNTQIVNILRTVEVGEEVLPTSGTAGDDDQIFWSVGDDGTLTISLNEGAQTAVLPDYVAVDEAEGISVSAPWADLEDRITKIVVGEGVTQIGENSFDGLENVTQVTLPASLEDVAQNAFDEDLQADAQVIFNGSSEQWETLSEGTSLEQTAVHIHTWGSPEWVWSQDHSEAQAVFTCETDSTHSQTLTAEVKSETTAATCEAEGKTVYTAVVTFMGRPWSGQATVSTDALGHDWGEVTYTWTQNPDGVWSVTAKRICGRDPGHVETETVQANPEVTKAATYTEEGEIVYTATYENTAFEMQRRTEQIPVMSASGEAPENLSWMIEDGVLTVRAKDAVQEARIIDYGDAGQAPWSEAAKQLEAAGKPVTKIVAGEGVARVGENSFSGMASVKEVLVGEGVKQIGDHAFASDQAIEKISLPKSLESISAGAFEPEVAAGASVSFAGDDQQWKSLTEGSPLAGNTSVEADHVHVWSEWETTSPATIYMAAQQKRTCSDCSETETRTYGNKLRATIWLSAISNKIAAGKKVQITATVNPGDVKNYPLIWTSSNPGVATVSATGLVSIKKKTGGKSVVITATSVTDNSEKASFKISVMKGAVKKVTISGKKSVKAGKSVKLKAKVNTTKGKANKKVQWTSSNTAWATVASNGKVRTYAAGKGRTVMITAMATDGSGKKKVFKLKIK